MPSIDQVYGNAEVVKTLQHYLEQAKFGTLNYVIVLACEDKNKVQAAYAGSTELHLTARHGLGMIAEKLDLIIGNHIPPTLDSGLGADYVCYNIPEAPVNFDFISWLIDAEMTRVRAGAPAPLKVGFWRGHDGQSGLNNPIRKGMFENVLRPALGFIGAVEDERAYRGRRKEFYVPRDIVMAVKAGENLPKLAASKQALEAMAAVVGSAAPVTITLREYDGWPHRNSNVAAWMQFADYLKSQGESVIFVRDTSKAGEAFPLQYTDCPAASRSLDLRLALYKLAKANLFVSNGPCSLALYDEEKPFLIFVKMEHDGHAFPSNTPSVWKFQMDLEVGEQFPWCRADQRMIWQPDSFEEIVTAWNKWIAPAVNAGMAA